MHPRTVHVLTAAMLGLLFVACGPAEVPPAQIELSLETPVSAEERELALTVQSIEAQIDGSWRMLSDGSRSVRLSLGAAPHATHVAALRPPAGALSAVRLVVSAHEVGAASVDAPTRHVELTTSFSRQLPACAAGSMTLVLENPLRLLAYARKHSARLRVTGFDVSGGTCPGAPDLRAFDLGSDADPACTNVICPPSQECRAGACVASTSCVNVVCPPGQACSLGQCVTASDLSTPADLGRPATDMCGGQAGQSCPRPPVTTCPR